MITLDKKSATIFDKIREMCDSTEDRHIKIDNSNGVFMPLSVEFLYSIGKWSIYSFSHYYKQNGDMCPDPDMTFFVETENKKMIIPATFQDSYTYREICELSSIGELKINGMMKLADLCSFSKMWMKNIYEQQELNSERVTV